MTSKLYLADSYLREFDTNVLAAADGWVALAATAFFPGGGGQPPDRGNLLVSGLTMQVTDVREDSAGLIWHRVEWDCSEGDEVRGTLDWPYRYALMRHHGLMHVVNAVALHRLGGTITGVQIGEGRSRIDFRLSTFSRDSIPEFERLVNEEMARDVRVVSRMIDEEEFLRRPELVRTLNVRPPVVDGRVRVVEMEGFDAQACGGTHVRSTGEIGIARIERFENKGKDNKRFYWLLEPGIPQTGE